MRHSGPSEKERGRGKGAGLEMPPSPTTLKCKKKKAIHKSYNAEEKQVCVEGGRELKGL